MKKIVYCVLAFAFLACAEENKKEPNKKEAVEQLEVKLDVEKLASDFKFTEGPAVDAEGNVYFTDIPEQKIWVWTINGDLELFKENSGGANGLFFDPKGNLLACEGQEGLISLTTKTGKYQIIADEFEGLPFNQPNDLWPDQKGGVYFTDPKYGDEENLAQDGMHVYYISPEKKVKRVIDHLVKPNGLIGTPDGKILYVTDYGDDKTFKYKINEDGSLSHPSLFVKAGGDGMSIDQNGNIYLTTTGKKAVEVFSPKGELIQSIDVPEQPSNVCFGGENRNELFITARTSLYKVIPFIH